MFSDSSSARHLRWDACYNIRDVGGYPTTNGGVTRWRVLLRADNLCHLTPAGQSALLDYGVGTVIDLRSPGEQARTSARYPFPHALPDRESPRYHHLPLLDPEDRVGFALMDEAASAYAAYVVCLERFGPRIATIIRAVAAAPAATIVVHCELGKDRTGLMIALLLAVAGVPYEQIAADYALSASALQPLYTAWLARTTHDEARRQQVQKELEALPATMLDLLAYLDRHYGGVERYLCQAGVTERDLDQIRSRLRG